MDDYTDALDPQQTHDQPYEIFDLNDLNDTTLNQMVIAPFDKDVAHWENDPWKLSETDKENTRYFMGDQIDRDKFLPHQVPYIDNRLFPAVRSILSYATGSLAKPEVVPSNDSETNVRVAEMIEDGLYQHALNHNVNREMRMAVKNLIIRKRGVVKLRWDETCGPYGDVVTENIDPSDIVIDRYATFGGDPNRIYQRLRCTLQELIARFPDKKDRINEIFAIKRGVYSQLSRMVTYWECWFSYYDETSGTYEKKQGVCWFLKEPDALVLGKMQNPNWIYKGSSRTQRLKNVTDAPIKPYVWLNYLNSGRSFIDETCLVDQAKPQQDLLNKRGRQIWENADYANPRILINGKVMDESDATKFVNKHPKTIGILNKMEPDANISNAVTTIQAAMLPDYVMTTLYDARNEIDTMMGTPSIFRGEQPQNRSKTLGQDLLMKQQAGALQDDLLVVINDAMATYYRYLLQMQRVYCTDDYWLLSKGKDGQYVQVMLNSDMIDVNVKIGIQADSTLPQDKQSQQATATNLANAGLIDPLSLYRDLELPDPEERAERLEKYMLDKAGYLKSLGQQLYNQQADIDIMLLVAGKTPEERDNYTPEYLAHFNQFISTNKFAQLKLDEQQRVTDFLQSVADKAAQTQAIQDSMLDPAGMAATVLAQQTAPPAGAPTDPAAAGAAAPPPPLPQ